MCRPSAAPFTLSLISRAQRSFLRHRSPLIVALLLLLATLPLIAPAQTDPQKTTDDDDVVRVSTELLMFPIRVRDGKGQAVAGLTEKDLRLTDKDKATSGLYF